MSLFHDIAKGLLGMFLADALLATATLGLVASVATLVLIAEIDPRWGGVLLILGCLAILVGTTIREAKRRNTP